MTPARTTAAKKAAEPVVINFVVEKDTKNTRRYKEQPAEGVAPVVGTLYVQNHVVQALGTPDTLKVTIEAV